MINNRLVNITLIITGFFSVLVVIEPELDLSFSEIFFTTENGFIYKRNFLVYQIFELLPWITKIFTLFCIIYLLYITTKYNFSKIIRSGVFFLVLTAIIGPGLVVNTVFKENFGRARPSQIKMFGGTKEFTPAFKITNQCSTNCSFPSGHAAMGFFFSAIAYVVSVKYFNKIYLVSLAFGTIVGMSRIIMGGHFLSDVVASAFIILFLNHVIFILWQKILENLKK